VLLLGVAAGVASLAGLSGVCFRQKRSVVGQLFAFLALILLMIALAHWVVALSAF
jgi:hypothetical protein